MKKTIEKAGMMTAGNRGRSEKKTKDNGFPSRFVPLRHQVPSRHVPFDSLFTHPYMSHTQRKSHIRTPKATQRNAKQSTTRYSTRHPLENACTHSLTHAPTHATHDLILPISSSFHYIINALHFCIHDGRTTGRIKV
jgi:hypothetical protein